MIWPLVFENKNMSFGKFFAQSLYFLKNKKGDLNENLFFPF